MSIDNNLSSILPLIGRETDRVELIKRGNDVFRLVSDTASFFFKTYTKDWYDSDPATTGFHVIHENMAWTILAKYGLSVPEVVYVASDCNNPVSRPFILTRELEGRSLTDCLTEANQEEQSTLLIGVGNYMRQMHEITFEFPGYLNTMSGPTEPADPNGWQHRCWSAKARETVACSQLLADEAELTEGTYAKAKQVCSQISARLAETYRAPRFTHGDCHAHQFFLVHDETGWRVTGVLDMEVSSAGDCTEDLLKISIELAQALAHETRWWESLFAGYGAEPDFEAFRLRLLSVAPIEYGSSGKWIRIQSRETMMMRILRARDWSSLFAPIA